jgi:hypothetical protein
LLDGSGTGYFLPSAIHKSLVHTLENVELGSGVVHGVQGVGIGVICGLSAFQGQVTDGISLDKRDEDVGNGV